ncbi:TM2 domain-containing protein [Streptomyces longispororuber]|nr:TM2 domain-containing protein [Streptomyces longispororuber]MCQ4212157.1 TM2 domain-containing protein [Streptomyces longispororuber]
MPLSLGFPRPRNVPTRRICLTHPLRSTAASSCPFCCPRGASGMSYAQPGPADPNAPYGYDPQGRPYSDKSKIVAGVLQLFLGGLGIGRFYVGSVGVGIAQLLTCGGLGIWALIDAILFFTSNDRTDSQGRVLRG